MKKIKSSVLALCALSVLSTACVKVDNPLQAKKKSNRVTNTTREVNQIIGDEKTKVQVISESEFKKETLQRSLLTVSSPVVRKVLQSLPQGEASAASIANASSASFEAEESLLIGFPAGLVGEQNIFGGVITKVSDTSNEDLGTLKLTDLAPLHVRTMITGLAQNAPALTLIGCANACSEDSEQHPLISLPIVGFNPETQGLILDMSAIGQELDLISMLDPRGEYTQLKAISSATTAVDFSGSTLVFDIVTKMIPVDAEESDTEVPVTEFTVRWYLKLNSAFNPAFISRTNTPGVGYFETQRSAEPKITRFSTTANGSSIHYYIKAVPNEWKKTFAYSFDNWNEVLKKEIGRALFTYEFIDMDDDRFDEIVAGDIRYNVVEWDLINKASYGGLGPSIANQFTGEIISGNVLIQGPLIIELYSRWYGVSTKVAALQEQGRIQEANKLMKNFNLSVEKELRERKLRRFALKLGKNLQMTVHAQRPELEDPIVKGHFDPVPKGFSYEEYMHGYFSEMLQHELGHNLGLRHNFKGNLGAYETGEKGSVSRSIMEYLGRTYLHISDIGLYDKMAVAYGYRGIKPKHLNWFCTDEDEAQSPAQMQVKSPECSQNDNTSDPFSFWTARLNRAIDLLVETKSNTAPVWNVAEIKRQIDAAVTGISSYALGAEKTGDTWTNFFGKGDRPDSKHEVKDYVRLNLKKRLCDQKLLRVIAAKESAEAAELALKNLTDLRTVVAAKTKSLGLYSAEDLSCE